MPVSALWQYIAEGLEIRNNYRFPQFPFENGTLIPTTGDLPPGKDQVGALFMGGNLGEEAILLAPGAADIPLTPVTLTTDNYPVVMAAKGYAVMWQEARTQDSLKIRQLVENRKIDIVRSEIAKRLNRFAAIGEPVLGYTGLYNNPNVSVTVSSFNPNTATYSQWVEFLIDTILSAGLSADGETVLEPDTILLSQRMRVLASRIMNPQNGDVSALDAAIEQLGTSAAGNAASFIRSPFSSSDILEKYRVFTPGTNRDRIVIYTKDPAVVSRRIESTVAQLVDEQFLAPTQGLTRIFPFFSCSSGTMIHDAAGIKYIDVVKAV